MDGWALQDAEGGYLSKTFLSLSLFRLVGMSVWNGMEMEGRGYKVWWQVFRFMIPPLPPPPPPSLQFNFSACGAVFHWIIPYHPIFSQLDIHGSFWIVHNLVSASLIIHIHTR